MKLYTVEGAAPCLYSFSLFVQIYSVHTKVMGRDNHSIRYFIVEKYVSCPCAGQVNMYTNFKVGI